jgi:hypothetical protein
MIAPATRRRNGCRALEGGLMGERAAKSIRPAPVIFLLPARVQGK